MIFQELIRLSAVSFAPLRSAKGCRFHPGYSGMEFGKWVEPENFLLRQTFIYKLRLPTT
ncbi:MAG TPA: hypothetical protein VGB50_06165 [Flavobacterium sp.]